jgi:hypothetical protein
MTPAALTRLFPSMRVSMLRPYRFELLAFLYFFVIALLRPSPYWHAGWEPTWIAGLALALLPMLPGLISGRGDALARGYLVTLFLPYQSAVEAMSCLIVAALLLRRGRRWLRMDTAPVSSHNPMLWAGVSLFMIVLQWAGLSGAPFQPIAAALAISTIVATPVALLLLARAVAEDGAVARTMRWFQALIVAEAAVIILYPLVIGHPTLLAPVINGFLKPLYTVFNRPWDFPWYDPDWNRGSLTIVNYSAVIMTMGTGHFFLRFLEERRVGYLLAAAVLLYATLLAENAMATGAAVGALVVSLLVLLLHRLTRRWPAFPRAAAAGGLILCGLAAFLFATYLGPGKFAQTHKGLYYRRALTVAAEQPLRLATGHGLGNYGSRVASLRLANDPYSSRATQHAQYPVPIPVDSAWSMAFTRDARVILAQNAEWLGSSQGMLTSGLIALVLENGAPGLFVIGILSLLLLRALLTAPGRMSIHQKISIFGFVFLLFLAVFYNYTEIPTIVAVCLFPGLTLLYPLRNTAHQ